MLHENFIAVCFIEPELSPSSLTLQEWEFSTFFAPVTLTLTVNCIHEPDAYSLHRMCKYEHFKLVVWPAVVVG